MSDLDVQIQNQETSTPSQISFDLAGRLHVLYAMLAIFLFIFLNMFYLFNWWSGELDFFLMVKFVYRVNTIYFPLLLLTGAFMLLLYSLRLERKKRVLRVVTITFAWAGLLFGVRIYATHIEPYNLQVESITIHSAKIKNPIRLLHITDIQSDRVGAYEERVFALIRELEPDLILHTGDLLQPMHPATYEGEIPKIARLIASVSPRLGFYGVIGDTDASLTEYTTEQLGGMHILIDESATILAGDTHIQLYSLSLSASAHGSSAIQNEWLSSCAEDDFTILMGHRPDFIFTAQEHAIDLCLAGHTHGGQIVIPFIGAMTTASTIPNSWASGFRKVGQTHLNVSAGVGSEHLYGLPSIRLNCPPQMTLFLLESDQSNRISSH